MNDYIVIIPARYNSKRLPGKLLIKIRVIPMIVRTYNQCTKVVPKSKILVATDDKKVKKTLLESIEDLELNRFIELGLKVKMLKMSDKSIAVDKIEDLRKVQRKFKVS